MTSRRLTFQSDVIVKSDKNDEIKVFSQSWGLFKRNAQQFIDLYERDEVADCDTENSSRDGN